MNKYANQSKAISVGVEMMRRQSCENKQRFPNQQKASSDKNQVAYKCQFCDFWHRSGGASKVNGILKCGPMYTVWIAKKKNKKILKKLRNS